MALYTIQPEKKIKEGCEVYTGVSYVISKQGVEATIDWPLYDDKGELIDVSTVSKTEVLIRVCDSVGIPMLKGVNVSLNKDTSTVTFTLPSSVFLWAGIYTVDIGFYEEGKTYPGYIVTGYLMIEATAFASLEKRMAVLPSINDIRNYLSDFFQENTLFFEEEYSNSDIIQSIILPVRDWNNANPLVRSLVFSTCNFPFKDAWIKAAAGYLCRRAVTHYMRNKLITANAGMQGDDLNRDESYMAFAQLHIDEWHIWVARTKRALNSLQFSGPLKSTVYSFFPFDINSVRLNRGAV